MYNITEILKRKIDKQINTFVKHKASKKAFNNYINSLENELNNLADDTIQIGKSYEPKSDLFNTKTINTGGVHFENTKQEKNLGESTASTESANKTWDGFTKFNNIPINPDKQVPLQPQLSKEDMLREKLKILRKINGCYFIN